MKKPLALALSLCGVLTLSACGGSGSSNDETRAPLDLTVLHVNDHHSWLAARSQSLQVLRDGATRSSVSVPLGGYARVTQAMTELSAGRSNVIKLHAGDALTGTLYYTVSQGAADAAMMNTVCFDALAIGNHEFDNGDAGLKHFLDALLSGSCQTAVLSANVLPGASSPLAQMPIRASTVLTRDGQRIGVVGLTIAAKTQNSSRPDAGTVLLDERSSAQSAIDALRADGIDKIVLLTHIGYQQDLALAPQLSGVDVIIGGDSHTLLGPDSLQTWGLTPAGPYPTATVNADGEPVCVAHAWQYASAVGELSVQFDENGVVSSCAGTPHVLIGDDFGSVSDAERANILADLANQPALRITAENPEAAATLAPFAQQVDDFGNETVGFATTTQCLRRVPGTTRDATRSSLDACNTDPHVIAHGGDIQQLVAEAFLSHGRRFGDADLSIQNAGGVRVDLIGNDGNTADPTRGTVTVRDVYTLLPFANTLVRLTMTGSEVVAAIEDAMEAVVQGSSGPYPYAAGLRWAVDFNQPYGSRLSQVMFRSAGGAWVPFDLAATYKVITNDFIAEGRDGYTTLGTITGDRYEDTFLDYADSFLQYVVAETAAGRNLTRLPTSEFSTQSFIDTP